MKSDDSLLASGAGDSTLILWKDVTKEEREAVAAEKEKRVLEEQQLANLMQQGLLLDALALAVRLDQPFRCLNILKGKVSLDVVRFSEIDFYYFLSLRFDGSGRVRQTRLRENDCQFIH